MAPPPPSWSPGGPLDLNTASSPVNRAIDRSPLVALSRRKLNAIQIPICYIDRDQRFRLINASFAEFLGRLPEQVVGHTVRSVLGEREHEAFRPHLELALRGSPSALDQERVTPAGARRWFRIDWFPDRIGGSEVRGIIASCTDIDTLKRLEQQARGREHQLRLVTDHIGYPICYYDRDRRLGFVNHAYERWVGMEAPALLGERLDIVLGQETVRATEPFLTQALAGNTVTFERRDRRGGSSPRWVRVSLFPDRQSGGQVAGVYEITADIEEDVRIREALQIQEVQLRLFTDNIPGPIVYFDDRFRISFVNQAWIEWFEIPRERVYGRTLREVLGVEVGEFFDPLFRRARLGEAVEYEQPLERRGMPRRWIRGRLVPDFADTGELRGLYATAHDVSDLKIARDAVSAREAQLRAIMDGIPAPVGYIGADERYRYINLAFSRFFGVPREATRTLTVGSVVGTPVYPGARQLFERALRGEAVGYERPIPTLSGGRRWMAVRLVPDTGLDGTVNGVFVLMNDVHDLKAAQEALSASEAQLRLIMDNVPSRVTYVDHELRFRVVNSNAERWFGQTEAQLRGRRVDEAIGAERFAVVGPLLERVLAGETVEVETPLAQPDGTVRWESVHFAPHRRRDGRVVGVYSVITDIHEARANQEALRQANWMLASHIDNTPLAVIQWDPEFRLVHWSPQAEKMFGWTSAELLHRRLGDWKFVFDDDLAAFDRIVEGLSSGSQPRATSLNRNYTRDGHVIWCEWYNSSLRDDSGRLVSVLSFVQDVSSRIEAEERLQYLATHDPLTALPNRVLLHEHLNQAIAHGRRTGRRVAVLFIDLDRFKNVNDSLGHRVGDELLRRIGARLAGAIRETDTLARLGGDEFLVVIERFEDPEVPGSIAVKLLDQIAQPVQIEDHEIYVTASVGIALFPDDGADADELFKNADVAMYRAKESGKNTMQFFSAEMAARRLKQHTIEVALRGAIKEGGLHLHYQPVVRIEDGRIVGAEALIRWKHPERGLIPPQSFIPPAEESGLIHILGDWVLREACRQVRAWHQSGGPQIAVAVNLSAKQFFQEDLANRIERIITAEGCEPGWIKLEVTETSLLSDLEMIERVLTRLRAFGLGVAIDDFGTGYSSLTHLKKFPIDTLKIDISFIADIETDRGDAAITEAIIALGRGLALDVIAEGVETLAQLDFLRAHGCGYCQGKLFSAALPSGEFAALFQACGGRLVARRPTLAQAGM